jgi:hypothetical protein
MCNNTDRPWGHRAWERHAFTAAHRKGIVDIMLRLSDQMRATRETHTAEMSAGFIPFPLWHVEGHLEGALAEDSLRNGVGTKLT